METAAPAPDTQTTMPLPTRRASSADAAEGRPSAGAATQEAAAVLGGDLAQPQGARRDLNGLLHAAAENHGETEAETETEPEPEAMPEPEPEAEAEAEAEAGAEATDMADAEEDPALKPEDDSREEDPEPVAAEKTDAEEGAAPEPEEKDVEVINVDVVEDESTEEQPAEEDGSQKEVEEEADEGGIVEEEGAEPPYTEMQTGFVSESEVGAAVPLAFLEGR